MPQGLSAHAPSPMLFSPCILALAAQDANDRPLPSLARLWDELLSGRCKIVSAQCEDTHCSLSLVDSEPLSSTTNAMSRARRALVEDAILGQTQKALAIDLGRSSATVSTVLHTNLQAMGLSCQFRCLPLALALLAHAARRQDALLQPSLVCERETSSVTFARPDWTLRARLSGGEYEVARFVLEGKTRAEMALQRRVSQRTIANQLQSVFSKLKVSGRFQLLRVALAGPLRAAPAAPLGPRLYE